MPKFNWRTAQGVKMVSCLAMTIDLESDSLAKSQLMHFFMKGHVWKKFEQDSVNNAWRIPTKIGPGTPWDW